MIVPIVLAAGASSRLGSPKALLEFGGATCLERVLEACRDGGLGRPILVVAPPPAPIGHFAESRRLDALLVVNPEPGRGQTSSLQVGLRLLPPEAEGFALLPVDHPLVDGASVRRLVLEFVSRGEGRRGVVPTYLGRRGHPLLAERSMVQPLLALPDDGSARSVLGRHAPILEVEMADDRTTIDLDTPEDLAFVRARWRALHDHS